MVEGGEVDVEYTEGVVAGVATDVSESADVTGDRDRGKIVVAAIAVVLNETVDKDEGRVRGVGGPVIIAGVGGEVETVVDA